MNSKIVTFTGGLGAQIISASAYFYLKKNGIPVKAAIDYFSTEHHFATPGIAGDMSRWPWCLDEYGLTFSDFDLHDSDAPNEDTVIRDGLEKIHLGFQGLRSEEIRQRFQLADSSKTTAYGMFNGENYACLHVRRGDYINVASHLISDDSYFRAIKIISKFMRNILVISDTEISPELTNKLKALPNKIITAMGGSPRLAHDLMRLSTILICSNSQLSYTAAALRDADQMTLLPSKHDAPSDSPTNQWLQEINEFQLFTQAGTE